MMINKYYLMIVAIILKKMDLDGITSKMKYLEKRMRDLIWRIS